MRTFTTILAVIVLACVFFVPGWPSFIAFGLLLLYGIIWDPSRHVKKEREFSGKWLVHWNKVLQNILFNGALLLCFFLCIVQDHIFETRNMIIFIACLFITIVYSLLMGMYKENTQAISHEQDNVKLDL